MKYIVKHGFLSLLLVLTVFLLPSCSASVSPSVPISPITVSEQGTQSTPSDKQSKEAPESTSSKQHATHPGSYYTAKTLASYLRQHGVLPSNYIKKREAKERGWNPSAGNLQDIIPNAVIGGDKFGNYEKRLPIKKGRTWKEADLEYSGGRRGPVRLLYSSDGLYYTTRDHYKTFQEVTP